MKIGIVVPNYNRCLLLERAIASIQNQNYHNYLVVVVDTSDEEGAEIILSRIERDSRIKVIRHVSKGLSIQRNIGVRYLLQDNEISHITFIDSDDFIDAEYLSTLALLFERSDADIVVSRLSHGVSLPKNKNDVSDGLVANGLTGATQILSGKLSASACGKLYSRRLVQDGGFDEKLIFNEDYEFNIRVFLKASSIYVSKYSGYLYWNGDAESMTRTKRLKNRQIIDLVMSNLSSCQLCLAYRNQMGRNFETDKLVDAMEQLLADNFLSVIPLASLHVSREQDAELKCLYGNRLIKNAVKHYRPYNRNTTLKRYLYLFSPSLFVRLAKHYQKKHPGKYLIAIE